MRKQTKALLLFIFFTLNFPAMAGTAYRISGPYTEKNLSIYLVHGKNQNTKDKFLTLGEAMEKNKVRVHETGNVNRLQIENISKKDNVYIQAGDIIKGGKQDRVFSTDMILEPQSGKVDISAFCVEKGRWSKRGKESLSRFQSSEKQLVSKKLRLATRLNKNQSEVWKEVSKVQAAISSNVGKKINDARSNSSLQLALENKSLDVMVKGYKKKLMPVIKHKKDVIGYAFSINGKLNTADIYANNQLFVKLWPKLLDSAATEAISEYKKKLKYSVPGKADINTWFANANKGKVTKTKLNKKIGSTKTENESDVQFSTYSTGSKKTFYHRQLLRK